ncbi:MAG: hypothetical protein PSV46_18945 [Reyranella sp.]|nr:hypothetical protein [Reyranella sp.]
MISRLIHRARAVALIPALVLAGATGQTALGQSPHLGPPMGVPFGRSIGPPTDNVDDFLGTWKISWAGSVGRNCPCQGTLIIDAAGNGELMGYWETLSGTYVLRGKVGYDQNSWSGQFEKPNDQADFPIKGQFLLMTRESGKITGSYQPRGTAIGFPVTGTR